MIRIAFVDFWPGFDVKENFFVSVIRLLTQQEVEIVTRPGSVVDLEFSSVFTFDNRNQKLATKVMGFISEKMDKEYRNRSFHHFRNRSPFKPKYRIWFTGEYIHPPHDVFDLTLSFEKTDANRRNVYFPYWWYRLDWDFNIPEFEIQPKPSMLATIRSSRLRNMNCCTFSTQISSRRLWNLSSVENVLPVTRFGSAYGNFVTSKYSEARKFGFQFCPENQLGPGYVTEKLVESWVCGNIPIWQGLHREAFFNPNAYIDITSLNTTEIEEKIRSYSLAELHEMVSSPLLLDLPKLDELFSSLQELIK